MLFFLMVASFFLITCEERNKLVVDVLPLELDTMRGKTWAVDLVIFEMAIAISEDTRDAEQGRLTIAPREIPNLLPGTIGNSIFRNTNEVEFTFDGASEFIYTNSNTEGNPRISPIFLFKGVITAANKVVFDDFRQDYNAFRTIVTNVADSALPREFRGFKFFLEEYGPLNDIFTNISGDPPSSYSFAYPLIATGIRKTRGVTIAAVYLMPQLIFVEGSVDNLTGSPVDSAGDIYSAIADQITHSNASTAMSLLTLTMQFNNRFDDGIDTLYVPLPLIGE